MTEALTSGDAPTSAAAVAVALIATTSGVPGLGVVLGPWGGGYLGRLSRSFGRTGCRFPLSSAVTGGRVSSGLGGFGGGSGGRLLAFHGGGWG